MGSSPTRTGIGGVRNRYRTRRSGSRGSSSGRCALRADGCRGSTEPHSAAAGGGDAAGRTCADRANAPRRTEPGSSVQAGSAPSGLRPGGAGCSELRADATGRRGAALARARASRSGRPTGAEPHGPHDRGPCCGGRSPDDNDRQLDRRAQQPEQHIHTLCHLGRRSRDYVGQRPNRRERPGAHGIRRHVRRLQRGRPAMAEQHLVSQRGPQSVRRSVGARSRVRQRLRRLAGPVRDATGIELLKTDHRQSQSRPNRSDHHPNR